MASANNSLRITELDFDSIKENLKSFMRERNGFRDFDFEGSNWNALLDVLAYNTHYMAFQTNAVANEMFLDTAQLRDSVLSHAKLLNYVPTSKRAATAYVNIDVTPTLGEDNDATTLTLNRYVRLVSNSDDGRALMFLVNETEAVTKADGKFSFSNVQLKQGDIVTTTNIFNQAANPQRRFNIPSANVDTTSLAVIVQRSISNTSSEVYTLANDITEVDATTPVYYLEENPESNGTYSIIFGDDYLGKKPANGSVIIMTYIDTLGAGGNKVDSFTLADAIGGYSGNVSITTTAESAAGSKKETIENIKFRAPIHYTTQNRCVTKNDFASLLVKDYPTIQAVSVWGGQDNDPPIYGKIFISLLPHEGYFLTTEEKLRIVDEIISDRSIVTVTPEIIDPEILYIRLAIRVRYDADKTTLDSGELESLVRAEVLSYKDEELVDFNDSFRASVLQRRIDNVDKSILGCELTIYVQKRLEVVTGISQNYVVDFGVPLKSGGLFDRIQTSPHVTLADINGIERDCRIEEVATSLTGVNDITVRNTGSGYRTAPRVTISGDGVGATATATIVNGKVTKVTVDTPGSNYTKATVSFAGGSGSGATAIARVDAQRATLYSYYFGSGGKKVLVTNELGTIMYDEGKVYLNSFQPISLNENTNYADNILAISAKPEFNIIKSNRQHVVSIDEDDSTAILITMVPEG
jgi:hypothetical protein